MKKFLLTGVAALSLIAGSALAADLPSHKGPPPAYIPPPPLLTWQGFYVGLNAGYTWGENNNTTFTTGPLALNAAVSALGAAHQFASILGGNGVIGSGSNGGFIGGGQIGYNWQFNNIVAGLEADIQGLSGHTGTAAATNATVGPGFPANPVVTTLSTQTRLDYLGTVRGRIGYLFTPTLLAYATGGLAYGGVSTSAGLLGAEIPAAGPNNGVWASGGSFSDTRVGWTVGGGLEWMFAPNWSAKGEYLYYDLGSVTTVLSPAVQVFPPATLYWAAQTTASTRLNGHVIRAGLNYHFNWGAVPVVAKY
jgi:outer membrane immunogenic protein